jgi:hypothetical protein
MKDRKIERRSFLKLTAAAAIAPSVLAATTPSLGAEKEKKLLKAVIIGMLPGKLSDAEKFRLAKKCGYDGIEAKPMKDLKAAAEQARIAREEGTPIHSLLYGWWPPLSIGIRKLLAKVLTQCEMPCAAPRLWGPMLCCWFPHASRRILAIRMRISGLRNMLVD